MNMCLGEHMKTWKLYIHVWYKKWWLKAIVNPYENDTYESRHMSCPADVVRIVLYQFRAVSVTSIEIQSSKHINLSHYHTKRANRINHLRTPLYTLHVFAGDFSLSPWNNKNTEASVRLQRLSIQGSCERKGFFSLLLFSFLSFLSNFNGISQCCAWFQLNSLFTDNRDTTVLSVQQFSRRINFACIRKRTQSS